MSTYIQGYRFAENGNPLQYEAIIDRLSLLAEDLQDEYRDSFYRLVASNVSFEMDKKYLEGNDHTQILSEYAAQYYHDKSSLGSSTDIYLIPFNGSIYGAISNIGAFDYRETISKQPWLEDWTYWNGSDRPSHISYSAWKQREVYWDMMVSSGGFSKQGARYSLLKYEMFPTTEEVFERFPSYEDRLKKLSIHVLLNVAYERADNDTISLKQYSDIRSDTSAIETEANRLRKIIPENYD